MTEREIMSVAGCGHLELAAVTDETEEETRDLIKHSMCFVCENAMEAVAALERGDTDKASSGAILWVQGVIHAGDFRTVMLKALMTASTQGVAE